MTTQQIIALANAGFTAQQIDTFSQAMGETPVNMNFPVIQQTQQAPQTPHVQQMPMAQHVQQMPMAQQAPQMPMAQQAPQMPMAQHVQQMPMAQQATQYSANAQELIEQERARQVASMNYAPPVTPQVTIGMQGKAGNTDMSPQMLAQYQAQNRYNAGMSIEKPPTMEEITNQIINGAVQESNKQEVK